MTGAALSLSVGGVTVAFAAAETMPAWEYDAVHRPFVGHGGLPRVDLSIRLGPLPAMPWSRLRYAGRRAQRRGTRLWAVSQTPRGFLVGVRGPSRPTTPARLARFDPGWTTGEVFVRMDSRYSGAGRYPLEFPLEVVFFPSLLAHHDGAVVHAAGAIRDGRGFLFAGCSGAGKTTIARLLAAHGYEVVNDERVIVRVHGDHVRMYGSPWPGDLGQVSPRSAPLAALFFLQHAPTTLTAPLGPSMAAALLAPRCRLPFWDRQGMAGLLSTIGHIVERLPCHRLAFAPDVSAIAVLERVGADGLVDRRSR